MAVTEGEITKEELQKEIVEILDNASLETTSTKKVIQKLEKKLGFDLTEKKSLIDQLVMDYVNNLDSDEDSEEEAPPAKPKKKIKKEVDDDIIDDSKDSDWGFHHVGSLLDGFSDDNCRSLAHGSTTSTSGMRRVSNQPRQPVTLKRVLRTSYEEDEADIFGKLTAKKLRKVSEEQRDSLMIQINQLFYDELYKRPMQDKATSTSPQYEANKVSRVGAMPNNSSAPAHISITQSNLHRHVASSTKIPRAVVYVSSDMPEPVVQATTSKQVVAPANESISEKKTISGFKMCDVM